MGEQDLPCPLALGEGRVRVRTPRPDDAGELRRIHLSPEVTRWWGPMDDDFPGDARDETYGTITVDGAVAGHIQFAEELEPGYKHAGIDLFVDPARHRQGVGSQAIRLVVDHLVDERGHHRITIDPALGNTAAVACYEAVGFERVGVMRSSWFDHGAARWEDCLLMELIRFA